jgi:centromere protein J
MSKKFMENYLQTYQKYIPDNKTKESTKKTENSIIDNNRKTTENSLEGSSNKDVSSNNLNDANPIQNSDIIAMLSNDSKLLENFLMFQKFSKIQNLDKGINSKPHNVMVSNNEEKIIEEIKTYNNEEKLEEINFDKSSPMKEAVIENNRIHKELNTNYDEDRPIHNKNKNFIDLLEEKMQEETPNTGITKPEKKQIVQKNQVSRPQKQNKNNKYDAKDIHKEKHNIENKVQQMDNNLDDEDKYETNQESVKIEKIFQNIAKPANNDVSNDKLSIKQAQLIQSKTKQLSSHTIPIKSLSEGTKNLNEKLNMEVNKMKEEIGDDDDDKSEDKEELDRENSVNSDDRNLSEILGLESKQITKTNPPTQKQDKLINKQNHISNGNANSNNILKKYFGIQPKSTNNIKKINEVIEEDPVDQKQAERERFALIVNDKMKEINYEISKLKNENDKVAKLKGEFERNSNKLSKDIDEYNLDREDQVREFEKWLEDEKSKFQREKKLHEKNIKAIINMPNKKEREEIEILRSQLLKLNEDNKKKDQSYKLTIDRLKKQLEEAQNRISDMSKEVKFMEELKSKNWGIY